MVASSAERQPISSRTTPRRAVGTAWAPGSHDVICSPPSAPTENTLAISAPARPTHDSIAARSVWVWIRSPPEKVAYAQVVPARSVIVRALSTIDSLAAYARLGVEVTGEHEVPEAAVHRCRRADDHVTVGKGGRAGQLEHTVGQRDRSRRPLPRAG